VYHSQSSSHSSFPRKKVIPPSMFSQYEGCFRRVSVSGTGIQFFLDVHPRLLCHSHESGNPVLCLLRRGFPPRALLFKARGVSISRHCNILGTVPNCNILRTARVFQFNTRGACVPKCNILGTVPKCNILSRALIRHSRAGGNPILQRCGPPFSRGRRLMNIPWSSKTAGEGLPRRGL
jgi:hypothetical protein